MNEDYELKWLSNMKQVSCEKEMVGGLWNYQECSLLCTKYFNLSSCVPSLRRIQVANKDRKSNLTGMGNSWGKLPPAKHDRHFRSALPREVAARSRIYQGLRQEQPGGACLRPLQSWTDEECHTCCMLSHGGKNMCICCFWLSDNVPLIVCFALDFIDEIVVKGNHHTLTMTKTFCLFSFIFLYYLSTHLDITKKFVYVYVNAHI